MFLCDQNYEKKPQIKTTPEERSLGDKQPNNEASK